MCVPGPRQTEGTHEEAHTEPQGPSREHATSYHVTCGGFPEETIIVVTICRLLESDGVEGTHPVEW